MYAFALGILYCCPVYCISSEKEMKQAEISLQRSEKSYDKFKDNFVKVLFVNINF
jgi:hypothetical protein